MNYRTLFCFLLFISLPGLGLNSQTLVVDSSFQPFFKVADIAGNPESLSRVWENPKTGKIIALGSGGIYASLRNGAKDPDYVGQTGSGNGFGFSLIKQINDSTLVIGISGNYGMMDTNGRSMQNWTDWRTMAQQTVDCATGIYPFFFKNGSSLMVNAAPGNPGGPGNGCRIVNPPDTFPHRFIIKLDSLGYWDSSFVPDAKGVPRGFIPYDSNRIWVFGNPLNFTHYDGIKVDGLCRIYHDGRLDTTFKNPLQPIIISHQIPSGIPVFTEADGGFFMRGNFILENDTTQFRKLARFHADGSLDSSFVFDGPSDSTAQGFGAGVSIVPTIDSSDQGYLIYGMFNQYQGQPANSLIKVDSAGNLIPGYFKGTGPDSTTLRTAPGLPASISHILPSKFGGYYVVGDWRYWDGKPSQPIVRLKEVNPVGLEDIPSEKQNQFTIYPNPVKENLKIETKGKFPVRQIELYDLSGRKQQSQAGKAGQTNYQMQLENMPPGLYFIVLQFENGKRLTKKFVKQ